DDAEPERRRRDTGDREHADDVIDPAVLLERRDRAQRDRDQNRDYGCEERDLKRDRQARSDLLGDRLARPHGDAEIEPGETPDEVEELDDHRLIEPVLGVAERDRTRIDAAAASA